MTCTSTVKLPLEPRIKFFLDLDQEVVDSTVLFDELVFDQLS
jgi:hypothetical protein